MLPIEEIHNTVYFGDPNKLYHNGKLSILQECVARSFVEYVKTLLNRGADPNLNADDTSPLNLAIIYAKLNRDGSLEIFAELLKYGAKIPRNVIDRIKDQGQGQGQDSRNIRVMKEILHKYMLARQLASKRAKNRLPVELVYSLSRY